MREHPAAVAGAVEELPALSARMRAEWVRFAGTGDPWWARYDPAGAATRVYGAEAATGRYPEQRSRELWREHRFGVLDLPG